MNGGLTYKYKSFEPKRLYVSISIRRTPDCQTSEVLTSLTVQAVLKWNSPKYWCGNRKWQQILFFVQFLFHPSLFLKRTFSFFSQIHLISSWRLTTHPWKQKVQASTLYTMGIKIFMKLHSNFYNLTVADDGQFKKEQPYVMNSQMKLLTRPKRLE